MAEALWGGFTFGDATWGEGDGIVPLSIESTTTFELPSVYQGETPGPNGFTWNQLKRLGSDGIPPGQLDVRGTVRERTWMQFRS